MRLNSLPRCVLFTLLPLQLAVTAEGAEPYADAVSADQPVAWWRFAPGDDRRLKNEVGDDFAGQVRGNVKFDLPGPRPSEFPDFAESNAAAEFPGGANFIAVTDPGSQSALDFDNGDAITLEAWVRWSAPLKAKYPYIVGKGRTHRPGMGARNQNYALRLAEESTGSHLSFFFCDAETAPAADGGIGDAGHRWTSTATVPEDGAWHHVAVTYQFGEPESIRGYVDGEPTAGKWDMAGATTKRPVVDDDELWIGSTMQGSNTFGGEIDEVAIYRSALSPEQIRRHVHIDLTASPFAVGTPVTDAPSDRVRVEIVEGLPSSRTWKSRLRAPEALFETEHFAIKTLPQRYTAEGLIDDQPTTSLLHLTSQVELPAGEYEFLVRSIDGARLYVDGQLVLETPFMNLRSDAHQAYYAGLDRGPDILSLAEGHTEQRATVHLEGSTHVVQLYRQFGNKGRGNYLGELIVAARPADGEFRILAPGQSLPFTDAGWLDFLDWERQHIQQVNRQRRTSRAVTQDAYWAARHDYARAQTDDELELPAGDIEHPIDRFVSAALQAAGVEPLPVVDDFDFLRRVSLDTTGVIPSEALIERFLSLPAASRRSDVIDLLLEEPGWADHWVGYWQDVLAENPGLTKPQLNNSGPFRLFLHESFVDNKAFDRLVTELIMMRGSAYRGGPAGFGIASQNDVPMAAKAHILGTAFLGVDMKCARCHDAPYHDVTQGDLFSLAAMLKRAPEKVPGSSSITASEERMTQMAVQVSLAPGSVVQPTWPFEEFVSGGTAELPLPASLLRDQNDPRERLAAYVTSPHNERFASVVVNRLWKRYVGRGIVEPVDDWEHAKASHPELLAWLARQLVVHDYDLKQVARLILTSQTYQRVSTTDTQAGELFAGPTRRRMTGEQLIDSLLVGAGKELAAEELTMDRDAKQPDSTFGHFGIPRRAWELVAVSNERDRPSLNLPVAQSVIDMLAAYGWRQQRQEPLTDRESGLTPLQPMVLANGTTANRIIDLSDNSALTALSLESQPVDQFARRLFQRLLTRPPTESEQALLVSLLEEGYVDRIIAGDEAVPPRRIYRSGITWSNHFAPEADDEAIRRQREVLAGDPPTGRLAPAWRERVEDAVWSLVNSPEFVFVP